MAFNVPTVTRNNVLFGPAIFYLGATGATPSTDSGMVAENGVTFRSTKTTAKIYQGNPEQVVLNYQTRHEAQVSFEGIELNYNLWARGFGTASTSAPTGEEHLIFGGDPTPTEYAAMIEHQAAQSSHTVYYDIWTVAADDGDIEHNFSTERHSWTWTFNAIRTVTNWAGETLASGGELWRQRRLTT